MSDMVRINISSAGKSYGDITAVDNVTLTIHAGECVALVGTNGAGKSTLFKLILGLIPLTTGRINILGSDSASASFGNTRRTIGFLPEQVMFQGSLTGRETLVFYSRLKGENRDSIDDLFARVRLTEAADKRVATYSKGMRQRLGLAQALIGRPEILILDEPTSGLDPAARLNFFNILEQVKAAGAAILMSSHALTELEARTDRVAILSHGRLVANGTIEKLKKDLSLPTKVKITTGRVGMRRLSKQFGDRFNKQKFVNGVAVLECSENQKLSLLKALIKADICLDAIDIIGFYESTLFKLILGLIPLTTGRINILGSDSASASFGNTRRTIGFLPEQVMFQGSLTGRETLVFYSRLKGENRDSIDDLFARVRLTEAADKRVATYSKGMRQRLGLAQALIGRPEILILDEPTSGLDPAARLNFFNILEQVKAAGAAILMSSHALTELEARTDRVAILSHGRLVANGTIEKLKKDLSLPTKVKITTGRVGMRRLSKQFGDRFNKQKFVNGVAVLECSENQKLSLLKALIKADICLDAIDIIEPSLEQVFSAYSQEEEDR